MLEPLEGRKKKFADVTWKVKANFLPATDGMVPPELLHGELVYPHIPCHIIIENLGVPQT